MQDVIVEHVYYKIMANNYELLLIQLNEQPNLQYL